MSLSGWSSSKSGFGKKIICPVCGEQTIAMTHHSKLCQKESCRDQWRRKMQRENRARKNREANGYGKVDK